MYPLLEIVIQPSFESIGNNYNFVRYGCNWDQTEKNLDILLKKTNFKIEIKSNISNFSLKSFPKFIELMNKKCKDIRPFDILINYICKPEVFSLEILDNSFLKYIGDFWYYIENNKPYFSNIDDMVIEVKKASSIINSLDQKKVNGHVNTAFEVYEYFKKERNIDILEYNPELYYYFKMVKMSSKQG
jgi:hypothetical protein